MLGDKYELELRYENKIYKLKFTFRFLKNLYNMVNVNPLTYVRNFLNSNNLEESKNYCISILYSMLNGRIEYEKLITIVKELDNEFLLDMLFLVSIEIKEEDIFDKEDPNNSSDDDSSDDDIKEFIKFWDINYYVSIYQLNMNEEEFLDSTPREIRTLTKLHKNFLKGIILDRDIDIAKAKNKASEEYIFHKGKVEKVQKVSRMRDLF